MSKINWNVINRDQSITHFGCICAWCEWAISWLRRSTSCSAVVPHGTFSVLHLWKQSSYLIICLSLRCQSKRESCANYGLYANTKAFGQKNARRKSLTFPIIFISGSRAAEAQSSFPKVVQGEKWRWYAWDLLTCKDIRWCHEPCAYKGSRFDFRGFLESTQFIGLFPVEKGAKQKQGFEKLKEAPCQSC